MPNGAPDQRQDDAPEPLTDEGRLFVEKMLAERAPRKSAGGKMLSSTFIDRMTSGVADPDWIRRPSTDKPPPTTRSTLGGALG